MCNASRLLPLVVSVAFLAPLPAEELVFEDFEGGVVDAVLSGTAQVLQPSLTYPGDPRDTEVLSLVSGAGGPDTGVAWIPERLPLDGHRTIITFDFWIRHGTSLVAGEGLSAVLQFGTDLTASGEGGGRLGTCNFPNDYVSVAFDVVDQGATDPETWCDGRSDRTCHVEVNSNICPGVENSTRTSVTYGVETPHFVGAGDLFVPVSATIIIDDGVLDVWLQTAADPAFAPARVQVLTAPLALLESDWAVLGFIGTTSAAYDSHIELDDIRVTTIGSGVPAAAVMAFGRPHYPLGGARLVPTKEGLEVIDVGASGVDGVRVELDGAAASSDGTDEVATEIVSLPCCWSATGNSDRRILRLLDEDEETIATLTLLDGRAGFDTSFEAPALTRPTAEVLVDGREVATLSADGFAMSRGFDGIRLARSAGRDGSRIVSSLTLFQSSPEEPLASIDDATLERPILADELRFGLPAETPVKYVDIALYTEDFQIVDETRISTRGVRGERIEQRATGSARIEPDGRFGKVTLSNIGPSGDDGARFHYGEPQPSVGVLFEPVAQGPCGGPNPWGIDFCGFDEDGETIAEIELQEIDDHIELLPDYSRLGASGYVVRLFRRGVAVAEISRRGGVPLELPSGSWPSMVELDAGETATFRLALPTARKIELETSRGILEQTYDTIWIDPTPFDGPAGFVSETCVQFVCVDPISLDPIYTSPPVVDIDLSADALEVTQSVQDLENEVPLIAGKPTFVRFHVSAAEEGRVALARLRLEKGNQETVVYPVNGFLGHLEVPVNPDRAALNDAYLFQLPWNYLDGSVEMTAEVNPDEDWAVINPFESNESNNAISTTVSFVDAPEIDLVIWRMGYSESGGTFWTPQWQLDMLRDWLLRAYPIASINWIQRDWFWVGDLPDSGQAVNSAQSFAHGVNAINEQSGTNDFPLGAHWYAVASDVGDFMRGWGWSDPPVASGPSGVPAAATVGSSWDFDGCYGDWYGGHEIGHTFGRNHPTPASASCGHSASDDLYPHAMARISTDQTGTDAFYGFDSGPPRQVYDSTWTDIMSYCANEWMSDYTYEGLLLRIIFESNNPPDGGAGAPLPDGDRMLVVGTVVDGEVETMPIFCFPDRGPIKASKEGDWAIVLRGQGGRELGRYPFALAETGPGSPADGAPPEPELEVAGFQEYVPLLPGTVLVEIESPAGVEDTVEVGPASPVLSLLTPNGGESYDSGDQVLIRWSAADADGDDIAANVEYSANGGAQWDVLALAVAESQVVVPASSLSPGDACLVRVTVTDGLHTVSATSSAAFSVAHDPPTLTIIAPLSPRTICPLDTLDLEASVQGAAGASDPEVEWSSDLDGVLGTGNPLTVDGLSEGVHTIRATYSDADGNEAQADAPPVTVVDNPLLIGATSSTLGVSPTAIRWVVPGGDTETRIDVFNHDPESSIRYQVDDDHPASPDFEVELVGVGGEVGGQTPGAFVVRLAGDVPEVGTHTSEVRLVSPDVPGEVLVAMTLVVLPEPTFVPSDDPRFVRGDSNDDGQGDISDVIYTLGCLFAGGACPVCPDAADVDDSGDLDISDAIYALIFHFGGGQAPVSPWPACGVDPTPDALSECESTSCP